MVGLRTGGNKTPPPLKPNFSDRHFWGRHTPQSNFLKNHSARKYGANGNTETLEVRNN